MGGLILRKLTHRDVFAPCLSDPFQRLCDGSQNRKIKAMIGERGEGGDDERENMEDDLKL